VKIENLYPAYRADLARNGRLKRKLRVAAVCGNGTAGAFAPQVLRDIGCEVIEIDCQLDHTFPRYNPNPEDLIMLQVMQQAVKEHRLDVAFGFDGDGDRCGVVDNEGRVIFADKIGLMLARDLSTEIPNAQFVVDVKSTGLYAVDPVLATLNAKVDYFKTGHSFIKRRIHELKAVAGFEKSGHIFFRPPFGHGYDDGIASALAIARMLDKAPGKSLADLYLALPTSFSSSTMSPHCDDEVKYQVVKKIIAEVTRMKSSNEKIAGQSIIAINTVNGVRFTLSGSGWGLVRASSNKPELVTVCESMTSDEEKVAIFRAIQKLLAAFPEVGAFNQSL
jgi:phosphomannomutase / phosphoglucomutase